MGVDRTEHRDPVQHASPLSFESLGLDAGLVLYETRVLLEHGENLLTADGVHDRAIVFVDGERAGLIVSADGSVVLEGTGVPARLQILVENQGRINYGPLLGQGKGIVGDVRIDGALVAGWASHPIPLDLWSQERLAKARSVDSNGDTGFATAVLDIGEPRDAFLALPGFGKGFVWIDDTLLGRYWEIGPQRTLYVPAPMFRPGRTVITVLELDHFGERLELRDRANLGPEQVYVETFD